MKLSRSFFIRGCLVVLILSVVLLASLAWLMFQNQQSRIRRGFEHGGHESPPAPDWDPSKEAWLSELARADEKAPPSVFDRTRGYFLEPFELGLSSPSSEGVVLYTVDGAYPTEATSSTGTATKRFDSGIRIERSTMVRAVTLVPGMAPSKPVTHTYLFLEDILAQDRAGAVKAGWPSQPVNSQRFDFGMDPVIVRQFSQEEWREAFEQIPTVSLVTDQAYLTAPGKGIFVNAMGRGREWERPASFEVLGGGPGFQEDAGLRIRGGYTRQPQFFKHAFRLYFRSDYGAGKLRQPLFGDEGAQRFDKIDLRSSQNYSWARRGDYEYGRFNTLLRDVFCRDTQGALGEPYTRSRYYHLFLNLQYWGIFMTEERPEAAFGATYFGGRRDDYDTIKSSNFGQGHETEAADGTMDAWESLWRQARALAKNPSPKAYFRLSGRDAAGVRDPTLSVLLEVDNLIRFMLVIFYSGNSDSPLSAFMQNRRSNNWFAIRNREGDEGFRFLIHDAEHTLGTPDSWEDRTGPFVNSGQRQLRFSNPQWIHQDLMSSPEYRRRFAELSGQAFAGPLSPEACVARLLKRAGQIDQAIRAQSARWGDAKRSEPYTVEDWRRQVEWLSQVYLPKRSAAVIEQLKEDGLFSSVTTL